VQLVSNATRSFAHRTHVQGRIYRYFVLAALPGPLLGMLILDALNAQWTRFLIGLFIAYSLVAPAYGLRRLSDGQAFTLAGAISGTLGVIVGAVGPLLAPFFLRGGFNKHEIIATKAVCQMTIHFLKIVAFSGIFYWMGWVSVEPFAFERYWYWIVPMAGMTVLGTYTGKYLLGRVNEDVFSWLYKSVLAILGLRLMASPWLG